MFTSKEILCKKHFCPDFCDEMFCQFQQGFLIATFIGASLFKVSSLQTSSAEHTSRNLAADADNVWNWETAACFPPARLNMQVSKKKKILDSFSCFGGSCKRRAGRSSPTWCIQMSQAVVQNDYANAKFTIWTSIIWCFKWLLGWKAHWFSLVRFSSHLCHSPKTTKPTQPPLPLH